jgi:hypothetical protein
VGHDGPSIANLTKVYTICYGKIMVAMEVTGSYEKSMVAMESQWCY